MKGRIVGDTVVLATQSPIWAQPHTLYLDQVIGGTGVGDDLTFGQVVHLAVDADGRVVVEDVMTKSVVRYDTSGLAHTFLGRRGEGPGEYEYPYGVVGLSDGGIAVVDLLGRAVSIFSSDGSFELQWPASRLVNSTIDVEPIALGGMVFRVSSGAPGGFRLVEESFVIVAPDGSSQDTVRLPPTPWDGAERWGAFHAKKLAAFHSDFLVVGVSDANHFDIHRVDGVVRVEQPVELVPVSAGERAAFDIEMAWRRRRGTRFIDQIVPPPRVKAAYRRILISRTGDIWVFRHQPGEEWSSQDLGGGLVLPIFREPLLIDVYRPDGSFQGQVAGPANVDPKVVSNDTVWAVVTGGLGGQTVARYLVR